jgi:uncharacterized membrane protein (UPF0182 family)
MTMSKYFKGIFWIAAIVVFLFGGAILALYTDWLWFSALGLPTLFSKILLAKIEL